MPEEQSSGGQTGTNIFIDSNVIANWLFVSKNPKLDTYLKKLETEKKPRLFYSYQFIENILNGKLQKDGYNCLISYLALTETFNVLFEFYVSEKMIENYISLNDWHKQRQEKFPEGTYKNIYEKNIQSFNKLKEKVTATVDDYPVFEIAGVFISEFGCLTHDAYLLGSAIHSNCKFFITNDEKLKDKNIKQIDLFTPEGFLKNKKIL